MCVAWLAQVQVLDEGMTGDDLIGTVVIPIPPEGFPITKAKQWYDVDTGGRVELQVYTCLLLTESNTGVGSRCHRGPHWTHLDQDGGEGQVGTVLGFRKRNGDRHGKYPSKHPPLCAVVQWDNGVKCLYPIGQVNTEVLLSGDEVQVYDLAVTNLSEADRDSRGADRRKSQIKSESLERARLKQEREAREKAEMELRMAKEKAEQQRLQREKTKQEQEKRKQAEEEIARIREVEEQERAREEKERRVQEKEKERQAEEARKAQEAREQAASVTLQALVRQFLAKSQLARMVAERIAAVHIQVQTRVWLARRKVKKKQRQRAQWRATTRKFLRQQRRLALNMQALYRGHAVRRLCAMRWGFARGRFSDGEGGGVFVHVKSASGLPDTAMFGSQNPYAKICLLQQPRQKKQQVEGGEGGSGGQAEFNPDDPFGEASASLVANSIFGSEDEMNPEDEVLASERTEVCEEGGTEPKWTKQHDNKLLLPLVGYKVEVPGVAAGGSSGGVRRQQSVRPSRLVLEIWDEGVIQDTLLGSAKVELPFWDRHSKRAKVQHLLMSLGGSVDCEVCLVSNEELDGGGGESVSP
jgi:hypothetical protein